MLTLLNKYFHFNMLSTNVRYSNETQNINQIYNRNSHMGGATCIQNHIYIWCHNIGEILLKMVLNNKQSINDLYVCSPIP